MRLMSGPATNVDHLIDEYSDLFDQFTLAEQENRFDAIKAMSVNDDVFSVDFK